jgi:DNA replication licensing factor MCM7
LAAANPLYGRYNVRKSISENVDLPNSLLSRFDLLFLILDRPDMEKDTALSKHVLHVHKHLNNPRKDSVTLPPEAFKQYIAAARSFTPSIPDDLTEYIVEAYVSMRQSDPSLTGATRRAQNLDNNQAVMTARQLLSILRLSQSLARLRLSEMTSHEDVDEAIRITHASKSSLREEGSGQSSYSLGDIMSQIYSTIRDLSAQNNTDVLEYVQVEAMILKKGFTADQLVQCLMEYHQLRVFDVDMDAGRIIIQA